MATNFKADYDGLVLNWANRDTQETITDKAINSAIVWLNGTATQQRGEQDMNNEEKIYSVYKIQYVVKDSIGQMDPVRITHVIATSRDEALMKFGHRIPEKETIENIAYTIMPILEVPGEWFDE
jgi:hypothetical protein